MRFEVGFLTLALLPSYLPRVTILGEDKRFKTSYYNPYELSEVDFQLHSLLEDPNLGVCECLIGHS